MRSGEQTVLSGAAVEGQVSVDWWESVGPELGQADADVDEAQLEVSLMRPT